MSDCTVNIADFRSIHPVAFRKSDELAFIRPTQSRGLPFITPDDGRSDIRLKVGIANHRSVILDIASNRQDRHSGKTCRPYAKVLSFDDGFSSAEHGEFYTADSDDYDPTDPSDWPPAA